MVNAKLIFLLLFLTVPFLAIAQEKVEREVGVKASKVPILAKKWLFDSFEDIKKPKWYLEYNQEGTAFEAKFLFQDYFHSIKFDSLGALIDAEIEIDQDEIASETWSKIKFYFDTSYQGIKIEKIQRQLLGSESDVQDYFEEGKLEGVVIRYEIVFDGKNESWAKWEAIFDVAGNLLAIIRIQNRSVDNLIF